ncbi:Rv0361 family membrane protein [Mycolicibacterium thermoresistibile]
MAHPPGGPGSDRTGSETERAGSEPAGPTDHQSPDDTPTEAHPAGGHDPATEVFSTPPHDAEAPSAGQQSERRFTAPSGFDAGSTQQIDPPSDPATEVFSAAEAPAGAAAAAAPTEPINSQKAVGPQVIPPRNQPDPPARERRSWGWVIAVVLVIAALGAIAILGTVLLTRDSVGRVSQEDRVRETIETFDTAIQNGDLATLRSITCGSKRDTYVNYDEQAWAETHRRVAAAKQYPVVASIDEVVVNGDHAEANVTSFMAYAPQTRSTRSFDLQFRDDQWKICQAPAN